MKGLNGSFNFIVVSNTDAVNLSQDRGLNNIFWQGKAIVGVGCMNVEIAPHKNKSLSFNVQCSMTNVQ
jgi:hypothetical protein